MKSRGLLSAQRALPTSQSSVQLFQEHILRHLQEMLLLQSEHSVTL